MTPIVQTRGQQVAEGTANVIGSWPFLITQSCILAAWLLLNLFATFAWDRPPFILLNLMLSFQAAYTGPVLLIAANAQSKRDHMQTDHMERLEEKIDAHISQMEALLEQKGASDAHNLSAH